MQSQLALVATNTFSCHDYDGDDDDGDDDDGDIIIKGKWADSLCDSLLTPDSRHLRLTFFAKTYDADAGADADADIISLKNSHFVILMWL